MSEGLHVNYLLVCLNLTEIGSFLQDLVKISDMKFKENSFGELRLSHADRHDEFSNLFRQLLFRCS
jgi:hypothetical protein